MSAPGELFGPHPWGDFHSRRFGLRVPLPDGRGWRIDDRSTSWLVAHHPDTDSTFELTRFRETYRMNRTRCEERARQKHALPVRDRSDLVTEGALPALADFDTRFEVRLMPRSSPAEALKGFVLVFGGWLDGCFAAAFSTRAEGADAEAKVGERLATMVERSLRAITLDSTLDDRSRPLRESGPDSQR